MNSSYGRTLLAGFGLAATLATSASAAQLNSRVSVVDPPAHTITTVEAKKPWVFTITDQTRFVDAKGTLLATGLKVGQMNVLEAGVKGGYLKAGTRLAVTYESKGDQKIASQIQLRDFTRSEGQK